MSSKKQSSNKEYKLSEQDVIDIIQKASESFEVLKKIKQIFDENGWKYYLAYGTLIGAIRHEGFIPWDDQIFQKQWILQHIHGT